jgi:hypothetical protein
MFFAPMCRRFLRPVCLQPEKLFPVSACDPDRSQSMSKFPKEIWERSADETIGEWAES